MGYFYFATFSLGIGAAAWFGYGRHKLGRDDLQHKFHLEDKVVLPEEGDDRNAEVQSSRPIKITRKPTYISYYV